MPQTDRSDGVDVRAELVKVIPNCRPSGTPPFSLSQDVLVPFLGIRWQPHHEALQDTLDEAITITTLLRGLVNFYASPPRASVTSSWTCATADADLRVRVTSGNDDDDDDDEEKPKKSDDDDDDGCQI